jgi:RimJ/RimL family protein N-acetyltransferase
VADLAPLYDLRLRTPRLELRLGTHDELVELGRLAERGVHPPEEMPFAVAWTDRIGEPDFLDGFLAFHEGHVASWSPEAWELGLLVWADRELVGSQGLFAKEFSRRRHVGTGSWLGRAHQGRGIGTEMRAAVLELAFRGLGAERAESDWLEGNEASRRVSEKLGYVEYAVGEKSPRGTPVAEHGVAVERRDWVCPIPVTIERLEACLPLFGAA